VPVFDAAGDVEAVAGTTRDITELRRLSLQKDEFIGIISHELRTPVTSVKAYAHILRRRFKNSADEHLVGLVTKMDAQLDKLTELIGDLLDVTRIDLGRIDFKQEPFELDRMVTEVVEILRQTTERHVIERTGTTGVELKGDRERTGQVLTNLISNAIKYSPESDRIIVRVGRKSGRVKIEVQDFGVGLAEQDRLHVFERFFRVSGPEHEVYPGIGLGLYLSAEIVRRQGGKIGVESTPGKGSTFWFTLPITAAAAIPRPRNEDA
jgi:signal transduction histidine kinase